MFLPISTFINASIVFSAFLLLASAFALLARYLWRWKTKRISFLVWLCANGFALCVAYLLTRTLWPPIVGVIFNLLLSLLLFRTVPSISLFGSFLFASLITPTIYGIIWFFQLALAASAHLQGGWFILALLLLAALFAATITFINTFVASALSVLRYSVLYFPFMGRKVAQKWAERAQEHQPFVSVHVPCYAEPPEMVIKTLDSLANLNYPNYEVILIDNNTKQPKLWKPLEEHCKKLGEKFRFYHVDSLPGAKAGALNMALKLTSPKATIIAVLDSDFIAEPNFLSDNVPFFKNPRLGFVQTCHDYHSWQHSTYQRACYFECGIHFRCEMPALSEWDAAYTVGTMNLFRREALEKAGGWAEWCLTEDSEVAVRVHALGYEGYYLPTTHGRGVIPETFENYKIQRFRWTGGPVQQFKKHWRLYLQKSPMTAVQKATELAHSLSLLFMYSTYFMVSLPLLALFLWLTVAKGHLFLIPYSILLLIPVGIVRSLIANWVAIRIQGGNLKDYFFSSIAGRSLTFTRYKAVFSALFFKKLKWKRTDKFHYGSNWKRAFYSARFEVLVGSIYAIIAGVVTPFVHFWPPDILFLIWLGLISRLLISSVRPLWLVSPRGN